MTNYDYEHIFSKFLELIIQLILKVGIQYWTQGTENGEINHLKIVYIQKDLFGFFYTKYL